ARARRLGVDRARRGRGSGDGTATGRGLGHAPEPSERTPPVPAPRRLGAALCEGPLTRLAGVTLAAAPLDLTDPAVVADPYASFARAREVAPVQWHEDLQLWLAFTHAEANAVLRDRRLGRIWRDKEPA